MTPYIQALISTTRDKLQQRLLKSPENSTVATDSLLFMGNPHDAVPRRLLQDPLLSPRDKFAWQVIRMQAQENGGAVFPSYSELQVQLSNRPQDEKASRSTVSRALLMLRLTRWLSLCHKARDRISGRILGNVYALHDEPLSVLDAVRFDASYLHLLEQCSRHENKSIRATAQGILYDIRQDTSLRYLSSRIELLEERTRWQQHQSPEETKPETSGLNTVPGQISPGTESGLSRKPEPDGVVSNQDQAPVRTVPTDLCNSTTARANDSPPNWPPEIPLTHPEKQLVLQAMQNLPLPLRQDVLDDAAQRVARGGIQNPLAYLLATLRKAQDGEFNQYRRGKASVPEFVPPVISEPEIPARPRKKRDISKLVAEIRAQCLGSG
ncbi:hypothetical protein AZ003_002810 [Citrobacter freundii]|uniref:STY4528 family pathogenicity island replication protein n=1 Tax=Citrobacter freundii TaxID=546 RepID=UPI000A39EF30|nr:STY4528 family pathogenicity island replication protein [Citrobacter freundii]OUE53903.1 hypothetical protein AZ003_002810 [Citrobacter freundii]